MNEARVRLASEAGPSELYFALECMKMVRSRYHAPGTQKRIVDALAFATARVEDAFYELDTYLKEAA